jgi:methyl acetate hydrolase
MSGAWTDTIDELLEGAVASGTVPGAAAVVAGRDGIVYEGAAGVPADAVWRIASMTKALASVAALQLVEEGKLELGQTVASVVPAFGELQVLDGFDGDTPRLRAPARQATVLDLFTHTSGHAYNFCSADLARYHEVTGTPDAFSGDRACLGTPLVHDPGAGWTYGISVDWLGQVVEAVDGRDLATALHERIFAPLAMTDTTFTPAPGQRFRMIPVHHRTPDGGLVAGELELVAEPDFWPAGHGAYSTAHDYGRFMAALLNDGELDGVRILSPESVALAFTDHLAGVEFPAVIESAMPAYSNDILSPPIKQGFGLGFHLALEDMPGMRRAGSGDWAGLFNCYFWIDRASGVAGAFFTQVLPFFDMKIVETSLGLEQAVYAGVTADSATPAA